MKALWMKYFHIPSEGVIGDRVFMARLTLDIGLILLYLFCMSYAACVLFQSAASVALQ